MIKNDFFAGFKERMAKEGRVITLPKDSPLRDLFGLEYPGEVEQNNDKEE